MVDSNSVLFSWFFLPEKPYNNGIRMSIEPTHKLIQQAFMTQYIVTFGKRHTTYCSQVYQKGSLCGGSIIIFKVLAEEHPKIGDIQ
jgi:hypothetical protein